LKFDFYWFVWTFPRSSSF